MDTGGSESYGRTTWTTRMRNEQGAQLVEFAFVLPLLLMILMGIITGGIAFNRNISVDNAAREAARYGATLPVESGMSTWLNDVADVAIRSATGDLDDGIQGRAVCIAYVYPDGSDADDRTARILVNSTGVRTVSVNNTCFADGRPNDERRVQVQLARDSDLVLVLWSTTLTLQGESTVRFERAT
jgi:Flp pilus assembly protein TadG